MKVLFTKILFISWIVILFGALQFNLVRAQGGEGFDATCNTPEQCSPNQSVPDINCINRKLFNPESGISCCVNKCVDEDGNTVSGGTPTRATIKKLLTIFGQDIYTYSPSKVGALANMAFTTVLGLISAFVLIYGIYVAGFERPGLIEAGEVERVNKTLMQLIVGFLLAWAVIFIVQVVFSALGLGAISDLQIGGDSQGGFVVSPGSNSVDETE